MTLENARVLYKHFIEIGRIKNAKQLLIRYPELEDEIKETKPADKEAEKEEQPKAEVKKNGSRSNRKR